MTRQRILYLAHRLPFPPDKGDRIRSWHVVSYLASRHDVWLACFADEPPRPEHVAALERTCRGVAIVPFDTRRAKVRAAIALVTRRSFSRAAYTDPWMDVALSRWCESTRFDAVVAYSSVMAPYALKVQAARRVLDYCDCDSAKWSDYAEQSSAPLGWLWRREARRLRVEEHRWAELADATVLITERERRELQKAARPPRTITEILESEDRKLRARTVVIPNGVRVPTQTGARAESLGPIVGFVGAMNYRPNVDGIVWFVNRVWPLVRARMPDARLLVIGRDPTSAIRRLHGTQGVLVTGTVPRVTELVQQIRVGIAPLRVARGIPNKVLELLAARRPVVATSAVAACLGRKALSAIRAVDDAEMFAHALTTLLGDDAECARAAEAGRRFVLARYAWEPGLRAFEELVTASGERAEFADRLIASGATERPLPVG